MISFTTLSLKSNAPLKILNSVSSIPFPSFACLINSRTKSLFVCYKSGVCSNSQTMPRTNGLGIRVDVELTSTLPIKIVHSNKFPRLRSGNILAAYLFSLLVPIFLRIFNSVKSSDISPRFRPLNKAEKNKRIR
ncbi:hypothetical protein BpHYR1_046312 [Brachionus plicatilis]|uniref:Uncharacterized protein n=1 Tax=Brachionus plicatilis TaxID=10195 RepID=A0A3M7SGC5_BRAPC|nr:hypothetical protein BpHYR1_046312 [Brachionus plicatilis]